MCKRGAGPPELDVQTLQSVGHEWRCGESPLYVVTHTAQVQGTNKVCLHPVPGTTEMKCGNIKLHTRHKIHWL